VDMSLLKYRELDMLVGIFELWMAKGREAMNLVKSFEVRVRKLMQSRLESKVNFSTLKLFNVFNVSIKIHFK
jgi:hypothetical protein